MMSVNLAELAELPRRLIGFSHNRFNLFSVDDRDHISLGHAGGIRGNLLAWLAAQGMACQPDVDVQLITFPRVFGYGFNPVSFYYVTSKSGEPLAAVAEVVNTFREMKLYLLEHQNAKGVWHRRMAKNFYVSPFSDPGDDFDFSLGVPAGKWQVNIDNYTHGEQTLVSSVRGEQRELNSARLLLYAFKYPLLSVKIIALIHLHALLLWFKRVPFFRKSERQEVQVDMMRQKPSLTKNTP